MISIFKAVLLIFLLCRCCHGVYEFDLFGIVDVPGNPVRPGLKVIPATKPEESSSVDFSQYNGEAISTDGNQVGYLAYAFMNSDDISFVTSMSLPNLNVNTNTFFTLTDTKGQKPYFKITLSIEGETGAEGISSGRVTPVFKMFRDTGIQTVPDDIQVDPALIPVNQQFSLSLRFITTNKSKKRRRRASPVSVRESVVTLSINCKEVSRQKLKKPLRDKGIPLRGVLSVGMSYEQNKPASGIFRGQLSSPRILTNKDAFELLNPCAVTPSQNVPSEPVPSEYDPTYFDRFVKMTSSSVENIVFDCFEQPGNKKRYSGEQWEVDGNKCRVRVCNSGEIEEIVKCETCKVEGKIYYNDDEFPDPKNPCKKLLCTEDGLFPLPGTIKCKKPTCDNYGAVKLETECCEICKNDTCTKENTVYWESCDRYCSDGGESKCKVKQEGCFCKEGYLLDKDGNCVKASECSCRVDSRVYQPNQVVPKSNCEICVCARGLLRCMNSC